MRGKTSFQDQQAFSVRQLVDSYQFFENLEQRVLLTAVIQKVELIKRDIKPLENQEKFLCRGVALSPFKADTGWAGKNIGVYILGLQFLV